MGNKRNQYVCPQCSRRLRFNSPTQLLKVLPTNYALLEVVSNGLSKSRLGSISEAVVEINDSLLDQHHHTLYFAVIFTHFSWNVSININS